LAKCIPNPTSNLYPGLGLRIFGLTHPKFQTPKTQITETPHPTNTKFQIPKSNSKIRHLKFLKSRIPRPQIPNNIGGLGDVGWGSGLQHDPKPAPGPAPSSHLGLGLCWNPKLVTYIITKLQFHNFQTQNPKIFNPRQQLANTSPTLLPKRRRSVGEISPRFTRGGLGWAGPGWGWGWG
jgi:hypothetical protein